MSEKQGNVFGVSGNMVSVRFSGDVRMNEVAYIVMTDGGGEPIRLKAEVIRIRGRECDMQVFEDTRGVRVGTPVEFTNELLAIELGPGLLSTTYDGLGNPLGALVAAIRICLRR